MLSILLLRVIYRHGVFDLKSDEREFLDFRARLIAALNELLLCGITLPLFEAALGSWTCRRFLHLCLCPLSTPSPLHCVGLSAGLPVSLLHSSKERCTGTSKIWNKTPSVGETIACFLNTRAVVAHWCEICFCGGAFHISRSATLPVSCPERLAGLCPPLAFPAG